MAAGAFFLCYYFLPHFNWELALKIAPAAGLCLLGGEVLYFAAKPEKWKYDFLSVFFCLCLMAVCLCMSALPMVLSRIDPANEARAAKIAADYENTLYAAIRDEAPDIPLKDLRAGLYGYYGSAETATTAASDLNSGLGVLQVNIELFGPYEQKAARRRLPEDHRHHPAADRPAHRRDLLLRRHRGGGQRGAAHRQHEAGMQLHPESGRQCPAGLDR